MKDHAGLVLSAVCAAIALGFWGTAPDRGAVGPAVAADAPATKAAEKPKGPPPLKVDRDAPLLLMDAPEKKKPSKDGAGPKADNSACYVCHTNYDGEELVEEHRIANVGCVKCHGESIAHRNDENNITPPDVMFPPEAIDPACVKCHETHDVPARKVLARLAERAPAKKNPDELVCTDCHGHHRVKLRTVVWDKKTGKLISGSGAVPKNGGSSAKP